MSGPLEKMLAKNKGVIEAVLESVQRGAAVFASEGGTLFPFCELAIPVLRLALDKLASKEVIFVKEQFLGVMNQIEVLSHQLEDTDCEIKMGKVDLQYFPVEENIRNQFRKCMDILKAEPKFREVKTKQFLDHFPKSDGDKNLHALYDDLMGNNSFGETSLDVVKKYVKMNRRLLEDFCVKMKELFCLGLIALLGHCVLTQSPDEELEDTIHKWSVKMVEVELKMKDCIEACVSAFPEQAEVDARRLLQEKKERDLKDTAREVLEFLIRKYDWVHWSVRAVNDSGSCLRNHRAGDHFQHMTSQSCFELQKVNDTNLVVSYSTCPQPVELEKIQQLMEVLEKKGKAQAVAEALKMELAGFVVHVVSRHKESEAAWSFPEDCHYWERHKNVAVCVHSE
ncbi:hypothetical protein DPEC_G00352320 [Dallia pectoralis]|uniref:Uncharacterized protein n=1 Tax=Dallia pectoralis TaxID=75939 RepID=A0ACC2F2A4_DALPE|nr:hypothetical protein DPEC_G00352320 [Dallia pectoralis]